MFDEMEKTQIVHEIGSASNKGKKRDNNQDTLATLNLIAPDLNPDDVVGLYIVADGVAGKQGGDRASQLAVRTTICELIENVAHIDPAYPDEYRDWLEHAVNVANDVVYKENQREGTMMMTTIVAAIISHPHVYIANVGDSRAYMVTDVGMRQITTDHSFAQSLVDAGIIDPEEVKDHPRRNVITQAIGAEDSVDGDIFEEELNPESYLLLCSDGLTDELEETQIMDIVLQSDSPQEASEKLIDAANQAGGHDNITVVLVKLAYAA